MITLISTVCIRKPYAGKSKFEFWTRLAAGDFLRFALELKDPGRGRTAYAPQIVIRNMTSGAVFTASLVDAANYMSKVEYD